MATSGSVTTSSYDGRYYKVAWERTGTSVANNTSTIKWTLSCAGGDVNWYAERTLKVEINGTSVYSKTSRVERYKGTIDSGTITIKHSADGTKNFSISVKAAVFTSSVNCTGSKTFTLTAIPRAATLSSATNFTDESNPTITYSNAAGNSVDSLLAYIYAKDDKTILVDGKTLTKTGTSFTFALTTAEITKLRDTCGDSKSVTVKFYIKTTISGSAYWSSAIDKTFSIVNAEPTITCSAYDSNPVAVALTGNSATIIKGFNAVYVSMQSTAKKGGTIVNEYISNGGKIHDITSGTITNAINGSFSFYAEDNRGFTKTTTITLPMINYVSLSCNINAQMTAEGILTFKTNGNYFNGTFGAQDNSLELAYRYMAEDGEYTDWIVIPGPHSGNANVYSYTGTITGLDYQKTYRIQVRAKDKIKSVYSAEKKVNAYPVFDWGEKDFNFNVPVAVTDSNKKTYNFSSIGKALFENTALACTVTPGANYKDAAGSCYIIGNQLRIYFSATRNAQIAAGNNENEIICSFSVDTGGKVVGCYTVYAITANNNSCVYLGSAEVNGDTLTFNIMLSSVGIAASGFTSYFAAPVRIDLSKF